MAANTAYRWTETTLFLPLSGFQCFDTLRKTKFKVSHKLRHRLYGLQHDFKPHRKLLGDSMTSFHLGHYSSKLITHHTWKKNMHCDLYQCPHFSLLPFPCGLPFNVKHHWDILPFTLLASCIFIVQRVSVCSKILDVYCSYSYRLSYFLR